MTDLYTLPDLPYAYDALEPWSDAETLQLHHDKHHRAYVTAANGAVEELASIDPGDRTNRAGLQAALTFNLGGHVLHSLFWECLAPEPRSPAKPLERRLARDFGSVERLEALLTATCVGVQGAGWGAIVLDPAADRLHVVGLHDHQRELVPGGAVIAALDVWEHAYYLRYRNDRAAWVTEAVAHLDWGTVSRRLDQFSGAASSV